MAWRKLLVSRLSWVGDLDWRVRVGPGFVTRWLVNDKGVICSRTWIRDGWATTVFTLSA